MSVQKENKPILLTAILLAAAFVVFLQIGCFLKTQFFQVKPVT